MLRSLCLAAFLAWPSIAVAQTAVVSVDQENFRAAPQGAVLATVPRGTSLAVGAAQDNWREVTLEGWIWSASVAPRERDGYDLVVSASEGENLRAAPNGERIARLQFGTLLEELERSGRWIRVRRTGWIWAPSISGGAQGGRAEATDRRPAERAAQTSAAAAGNSTSWARIGEVGTALLSAPDKDTLAAVRPLAPVEVVSREGNWARVRMEGWVWVPALAAPADTGDVLRNVSPQLMASNPQGFRGRLVEWTVQYIALERADRIRTDFYEGEPFILARGPGEEAGFVYIAVPPERVEQIESLSPLQRITVLGRVRNPHSTLMAAPVLDLHSIR